MPDTYLRVSQVLALEFQAKILSFFIKGEDIVHLDAVPLGVGMEISEVHEGGGQEAGGQGPDAGAVSSSSSSSDESSSDSTKAATRQMLRCTKHAREPLCSS